MCVCVYARAHTHTHTQMQAELEPQGRHVSKQCLGLTYVDDDGDDIAVSSDHEVRHCVRLLSRSLVCARELMIEEGSRAACNIVFMIF